MRRVVAGTNAKGRSYVVSDDDVDGVLWEIDPATSDGAQIDAASCAVALEPASGCTRFVTIALPPLSDANQPEMPPGMDENGFHTTRTVDQIYVVDGTITLALDEESVKIHGGESVVLQAAHHAWHNTSDRPVRLVAVMTTLV
jgi:quercetin dioxygenase-like cupin family protein